MRIAICTFALLTIALTYLEPGAAPLFARMLALSVGLCLAIAIVRRGVRMVAAEPVRSPFLPEEAKRQEAALPLSVTWVADEVHRGRNNGNLSPVLIGRIREVASSCLLARHRLDVTSRDDANRIIALVSPPMAAILNPGVPPEEMPLPPVIPNAALPILLSELERL